MEPTTVIQKREARPDGARALVRCEQAIFTSMASHLGAGYRIVAASRGIHANERQEITARSPSHGGLCDSSPQAVAVACYPLASGAFCVAHTHCAGAEHTGRGGQTVYTRAVVLKDEDFQHFADNPFNVVRAMQRADHTGVCASLPTVLPPLELEPLPHNSTEAFEAALHDGNRPGAGNPQRISALLSALSRLLSASACESVIIAADDGGLALVEAVVLAIPAPLRLSMSFACGLRYSKARGARINCLHGDLTRTRELLRGHSVCWIDLHAAATGAAPAPAAARTAAATEAWVKLVERYWSGRRYAELLALTGARWEDCSGPRREGVSRICLDIERVGALDLRGTLDLIRQYLHAPAGGEVEDESTERLLVAAQRRLIEGLATSAAAQALPHGAELLELALRTPEATALLLPACSLMLARTCGLEPARAARWGAMLARQLRRVGIAGADDELSRLLDEFGRTVTEHPAERLAELRAALGEWDRSPALSGRLDALRAAIEASIGEADNRRPAARENRR